MQLTAGYYNVELNILESCHCCTKTTTTEIAQVTSLGYGLKKAISEENKRPCLLVRKFYLLKEAFLKKNWQTMMSVERELEQIDFISGLRMAA